MKSLAPSIRNCRAKALTLVELLVVIGIVTVLIALFLPVLTAVRARANAVVCASHLRTLGMAFHDYAIDFDGRLPPAGLRKQPAPVQIFDPWFIPIAARLGEPSGASFGTGRYNSCPGFETDGTKWMSVSYGLNYPGVFAWLSIQDPMRNVTYDGSALLRKVPADVFLACDAKTDWNENGTTVLNPNNANWPLNVDSDGDGVLDSNSGELFSPTSSSDPTPIGIQYNGFAPRHMGGGNFVFADGSVRWISVREWATNADGLWGAGDNSYK